MSTMLEIVKKYADTTPEALFTVDVNGEYTYKDAWNMACNVAKVLKRKGIKKNDCIMVECSQDVWFLVIDFACNIIGALFVPLEKKASADRIKDIYEDTKAVLFVYENEVESECAKISFEELRTEVSADDIINESIEVVFPDEEEVAEILYTTGTTGKSKGIVITHKNNIALAENIAYGTEMKQGNVELIPLPISHSHGIRCCYANIFRGGCVVLTDGIGKIVYIYNLIKQYNITAIDASPAAMTFLMKLSKGKFSEFNSQFDYIQIGTAMLSEDLKTILKEQFPDVRLYNFYGSTESGRSCVLNFNSADDKKYCIGKPTKNARFIVTDQDRNIIESSESNTGLLACAGAMNMKEYLNQPELTKNVYNDEGYIFTADEAYIDERGYVYVLGRMDDVINFKGIKIAPGEIEDVAANYKGIKECACVPLADKTSGQVPKLFVVPASSYNKDELVEYLKEHIDSNKMPKVIAEIDEIPKTYNGKIKRKELIAMN